MRRITSTYSRAIARRSTSPPPTQNYTLHSLVNMWYQLLSLYNCHRELLQTLLRKTALRFVSRRYVHAVRSKLYGALVKCREGLTHLVTRGLIVGLPADSEIADKGSNPHIFCCFLPPPSLSGHQHKRNYFLLRRSRRTMREIQQSPFRTFKT